MKPYDRKARPHSSRWGNADAPQRQSSTQAPNLLFLSKLQGGGNFTHPFSANKLTSPAHC